MPKDDESYDAFRAGKEAGYMEADLRNIKDSMAEIKTLLTTMNDSWKTDKDGIYDFLNDLNGRVHKAKAYTAKQIGMFIGGLTALGFVAQIIVAFIK